MVIDFCTAKNYEIDLGETTGIIGTIGYAAPEQYIGSGLGRTDANRYLLFGITLYHLLTNVDPCKTNRQIHRQSTLPFRMDWMPYSKITQHGRSRYQTCAELMYDLETTDLSLCKKSRRNGSFLITILLSILLAIGSFVLNLMLHKWQRIHTSPG